MRRIAYFVFAFAMIGLSACAPETPTDEALERPRIAQMSSLRGELIQGEIEDYLEMWQTLTPEQRYQVWHEKLTEVTTRPGWNAAQLAKLEFYLGAINPSWWKEPFTDEAEAALYADATSVFSPRETARIFMDVYPYDNPPNLRERARCVCRWSIYCGVMTTCDYGGCDVTFDGCGMLGTSSCKGLCDTPTGM